MLTIHRFGSHYRVLEFQGIFAPQQSLNGGRWYYFYSGKTPVEFSSLYIATQYLNSTVGEVKSYKQN